MCGGGWSLVYLLCRLKYVFDRMDEFCMHNIYTTEISSFEQDGTKSDIGNAMLIFL